MQTEGCEEPSLMENKECEAAEISADSSGEQRRSGPDEDDLEDKSSVESTLESQISDTISHPEGETFEKTQSNTEITEKLSEYDDLREEDCKVDDDEELGLIDNENNSQNCEENKSENQPEDNEIGSEGESQEEVDNDDRKSINTEENNDDGNTSDEKHCENMTDPDEDDSWEYEWEDEEDNEFEFFEVDEDEYKVQTFDGSFSIAI